MKRLLSLLLAFALILACTPVISAAEQITSGDYTYTVRNGKASIVSCNTAISGDVTIPSVLDGYPVTGIDIDAFNSCSQLTDVTIPDSVTYIDYGAFAFCTRLTSVVIPDSVTVIAFGVFQGCYSLTSIELPNTITTIDLNAFSNCRNLKTVYYKGTEKEKENIAIESGNSELLNATWICEEADEDFAANGICGNNLTWVLDETGTLTISGTGTMYDYSSTGSAPWYNSRGYIESVVIEEGVTAISSGAFQYCQNMTSVTVRDSVKSIGDSAFAYCSSLTSVEIPGGVEYITTFAFGYCSSLARVVISEGTNAITQFSFYDCDSLKEIVLPKSVTVVSFHAFKSCDNITDVYYQGTKEDKEGIFIDSGNESLQNANWIYASSAGCEYLETGKDTATQFETFEEAMAVATGGTIKLLADVTAGTVMLKPGVTLDLNGHALTADMLIVMSGATVLDGGADCVGGGKLNVAKEKLLFVRENGQGIIPVWNGTDGYVFTKVTYQQLAQATGAGVAQYIFLPSFSNAEAAALMADGGADNGLKLKVGLTWNDGQCQQFYTYDDGFVGQVFASNGGLAFSLTVTGIAGITDMTASAMIVTDSYAQASATATAIKAG